MKTKLKALSRKGGSFLLLSLITFTAHAGPCDFLTEWKEVVSRPTPETLRERSDLMNLQYEAKLRGSERLYQDYFSGRMSGKNLEKCLVEVGAERDVWNASLSSVFFKRSLEKLKSSKLPAAQKLTSDLAKTQLNDGMALFRAVPHAPEKKKAGVYRGAKSLFMSLDLVTPQEWVFILTHELVHYTDSKIAIASKIWNNRETVKKIFEIGKTKVRASELSNDEYTLIKSYLMAGFDRGLLAEYRAWLPCFSSYESGIREGLWGRISWMDELLLEKSVHESWESFTFRYLDQNFTDPEFTGFFSIKVVQEMYFDLREELRQ